MGNKQVNWTYNSQNEEQRNWIEGWREEIKQKRMNIPLLIIQGDIEENMHDWRAFNQDIQNGTNANVVIHGNIDNITLQEFKHLVLPHVQQVVGLPVMPGHLRLRWQGNIPLGLDGNRDFQMMINPNAQFNLNPTILGNFQRRLGIGSRNINRRIHNMTRNRVPVFPTGQPFIPPMLGPTSLINSSMKLRWALHRCMPVQQPVSIFADGPNVNIQPILIYVNMEAVQQMERERIEQLNRDRRNYRLTLGRRAQNDNNENVARQVSLFPIIPTITYSIKF